MDNIVRHVAGMPRRLAACCRFDEVGFLPGKPNEINRAFSSFNYSFLLSGEGFYDWQGERRSVKAPCVLTQYPGVPARYGPSGTWDEIYFIYPAEALTELRRRGLVPEEPFWRMSGAVRLMELADELKQLLRSPEPDCDRLDLLAESMVIESLLSTRHIQDGRHEQEIRSIALRLRRNPQDYYDWEEVAQEHGISLSTFRRYFQCYLEVPPAEYLQQCRIDLARRLLTETALPVAEVARRSGFEDPYYFSRRFRQCTKETAVAYRRRYRQE